MRVTGIRLQNFRSFIDSDFIALDSINVLVGANNSGKSTILRGLHQIQHGLGDLYADIRVDTTEAVVTLNLAEGNVAEWTREGIKDATLFVARLTSQDRKNGEHEETISRHQASYTGSHRLPPNEPNHFIVPFLSRRKATSYREEVRQDLVSSIAQDASNLSAKLSRLANPSFPAHASYAAACRDLLGFVVTAVPSTNGQRPGIYLPDMQQLDIQQLGEGVPNIVYLLTSLAVSEGKLFLIEEPENDLHPQALKALLDLVIESSSRNQFVISTHSNIVVRHLCSAQNSRLFRVRVKSSKLPIESEVVRVAENPEARHAVLAELGYSLSDFELWEAWLVLEEASAERIIRDFLVPWFVPRLSRMRTLSSSGVNKVSSMVEELNRVLVFLHLTPAYKERSWVIVDGDDAGCTVVNQLRDKYPTYTPDRFNTLKEPAFEKYYPREFSSRVEEVLAISDKGLKREAKRVLLLDVIKWLDADRGRGEAALLESAREVIELLRAIEVQLAQTQARA